MNTFARILVATVLAAPAVAAPPAAADSVVRVHASNAASFVKLLPALPSDVPWLAFDVPARPKQAMLLPEAGSAGAWMLSPSPAEAWSSRPIQSPARTPSFAGM
jgi:hypothetical protein